MSNRLIERFKSICENDLRGEVLDRGDHLECDTDLLVPEGGMILDDAFAIGTTLPNEDAPRAVTHAQEVQIHPEEYVDLVGARDDPDFDVRDAHRKAIFISTDFGTVDTGGTYPERDKMYGTDEVEELLKDEDVPIYIQNWETGNTVGYVGGAEHIAEAEWTK